MPFFPSSYLQGGLTLGTRLMPDDIAANEHYTGKLLITPGRMHAHLCKCVYGVLECCSSIIEHHSARLRATRAGLREAVVSTIIELGAAFCCESIRSYLP